MTSLTLNPTTQLAAKGILSPLFFRVLLSLPTERPSLFLCNIPSKRSVGLSRSVIPNASNACKARPLTHTTGRVFFPLTFFYVLWFFVVR